MKDDERGEEKTGGGGGQEGRGKGGEKASGTVESPRVPVPDPWICFHDAPGIPRWYEGRYINLGGSPILTEVAVVNNGIMSANYKQPGWNLAGCRTWAKCVPRARNADVFSKCSSIVLSKLYIARVPCTFVSYRLGRVVE